ncbi:MAG: hypothetical protein KJT03_20060, partial [Verrucomicrobiae bacterium]|nr:hypothetical protein [Verrucomicrobiae bacterium]
KLKYDFTIELHTDPRWRHHTFSISSPERIDSIVSSVSKAIGAFIGYAGISGRGKDQDWEILHNSPECPTDLKEKIKRHN